MGFSRRQRRVRFSGLGSATAVSACLVLGLAPRAAEASWGKVAIDARTHDTISISWSEPVPFRQYCGVTTSQHKLCIKETNFGSAQETCRANPPVYENRDTRTHQFTDLSTSTEHKIKVYSRTTKANGGGDCKYRKVNERTVKTTAFVPMPRSGSLSAFITDHDFIQIEATYSHPGDFQRMRVCYKQKGYPFSLKAACQVGPVPIPFPLFNTPIVGLNEVSPVGSSTLVGLSPLTECKRYRFAGVGFASVAAPIGTFVDEVVAATTPPPGGACKRLSDFEEYVAEELEINDPDGTAHAYLSGNFGSLAVPANLLTDPDFEPVTALHDFFRLPGDPYIPGEWNAEDATVFTTPDLVTGILPKNATGMLRMNAGGGSSSQVNQIIGPIGAVSPSGDTLARWAVYVNASAATPVTLLMNAGSGQTSVGTLTDLSTVSVPFTTDGDPATWERVEGTRTLPATTAFLEVQIASPVAQVPLDGLFVDFAGVMVDPSGLLWDLAQFDPVILTDAAILAADGEPLDDDAALFAYLLDHRIDVFRAWQDQLAIDSPDLVLVDWLLANHPVSYWSIALDFGLAVPTLSPLAAVGAGLTLWGVAWGVLRRYGRRLGRS